MIPKNINWDKIVKDTVSGYVGDDFIRGVKTYKEVKPKDKDKDWLNQ